MIDQWFKEDLEKIYDQHSVAVFIDESGNSEFLLKSTANTYTVHKTQSEIDELHVKYLIEKSELDKVLIYTQTKKEALKFVREYCETNGCLEIHYLTNYIKTKVHENLNLNINLPDDELIAAAKVSVGKDRTYWMDLSHKGAGEIFDLEKELLPFIHDPETYSKDKYDAQLRETFYRKVSELLGQDYIQKPAQTLANEIVKKMLDGLALGSCDKTLKKIYSSWLDSLAYRKSFFRYLEGYKLPTSVDIWKVDVSHPFTAIDELWLKEIGANISNRTSLPNFLAKIKQRDQNTQAQSLEVHFWKDVQVLLEFDSKDIAYLSSFSECVEFYTKHFYTLDTAIRNLYTEFLNKRSLIEPLQEHYKELVSIFLDKWFQDFEDYKEEQTGTIQNIIDNNSQKIAIIVGDGVAYEMACQVELKVSKSFKLTKKTLMADIPSETENNMSRLYMANGVTEAVQNKREKYLSSQNPDKPIDYIKLDEVNDDALPAQYLICTYKDIDEIGDKMNNKALKYFPEAIDFFAEKINQLLNIGYKKVYLITDHGFVLTGLLSESEKIALNLNGESTKAERYIRAEQKQSLLHDNYIEAERSYKNYNYLYFSKNMNPFKTPGLYGFSHGGLAPQELVTPYFCWERTGSIIESLDMSISNKADLASVTGELYQLKLKTGKGVDGNVFTADRKVYLVFFSNKTQFNKSDVFTMRQDQLVKKEYTFDGHPEIEVQLLDAQTKEQLDRVVIKQNNDRDLGGLF